ncbi:MAG: DUF521 domain-containing protein [Armatimonadetes bacterium]|nr:DUF521 domain-containing protein [Armatimonadota bacterium]
MLRLTDVDRSLLGGERGPAAAMAMRIVLRMAYVWRALAMLDITGAHIDGCLYHGDGGLEFAERLASSGGRVAVPATLNIGSLDFLRWRAAGVPAAFARKARSLADAYLRMGCRPTWTCAPYQDTERPAFGAQIAWGESNAIVFANSVLGARTNRYGDFLDICAAITGRVPAAGLHLEENRRGEWLFRVDELPAAVREDERFYPLLGYFFGMVCQERVPVIDGLPPTASEDDLKALGAAAASSGAVGLFHAVGITPEAPTLSAAFGVRRPSRVVDVTLDDLRDAHRELSREDAEEPVDLVALGSPHFSLAEFRRLKPLLDGVRVDAAVDFVVCTGRATYELARTEGLADAVERAGGRILTDTCVVNTPGPRGPYRLMMTNSAKFAHYGPGKVGCRVALGSLADCVRSARAARVVREEDGWLVAR